MNEPLPRGSRGAIKAIRHRVPHGTPEEVATAADEAFGRIVDVMRGNVRKGAGDVLRAATAVRAEVCGPIVQKLEHTGADGQAMVVEVRTYGPEDATPANEPALDEEPESDTSGEGG